jgi:hypothetical protein
MNKIILQPARDPAAVRNYQQTVVGTISILSIAAYLSKAQQNDLWQIYPSGTVRVWGARAQGNGATKWGRIATGDITLFAREKMIFSSAVVTYKLHSEELAAHLWGFDHKNKTWEYIFFLDEVKPAQITYLQLNRLVDYADNANIQGLNVLSEELSRPVLEAFDLYNDTYIEAVDETSFDDIVDHLETLTETDSETKSYRRLEQGYLKSQLFGKKTIGTCGMCQHDFPVSLLVAAHIKKRSICTLEERKDRYVVMPMCKFGCDDLFEKGFIAVQEGKVISLNKQLLSPIVTKTLERLVGSTCSYYNNRTAKYFQAHYEHHTTVKS